IVLVDVVVHFRDQAVHAIGKDRGRCEIWTSPRKVGSRPRMQRQQILYDHVTRVAGRERTVGGTSSGHATQTCLRSRLTLAFVFHVEKCLVLDDRAAQRSTELVVVEWILSALAVEVVPGTANRTRPVVYEPRAVELIGSAFCHDIDYGTGVATVLSLVV